MTSTPDETPSLYEQLGAAEGLRHIVACFYQRMDTEAPYAGIRAMHPADLRSSADKLFHFLSGWTGGPQLFVEKHGPPMMRARHLPFQIGKSERDQWVLCMVGAVDDCGIVEPVRSHFLHALLRLADHMRNQTEPS